MKPLTDADIRDELRRAIRCADTVMELLCNTALGYPKTSELVRQRIMEAIDARKNV